MPVLDGFVACGHNWPQGRIGRNDHATRLGESGSTEDTNRIVPQAPGVTIIQDDKVAQLSEL